MQPWINEEELGKEFLQLRLNVVRLRSPEGGCPWFRQQTFSTLRKYLLEEVYEVQDALNSDSPEQLQEELGDLLFQCMVLSELASERAWFSLREVMQRLNGKIIHRNPHVFGEGNIKTVDEAQQIWLERKSLEKASQDNSLLSPLDGLSTTMPALALAQAYVGRCDFSEISWGFPFPALIHDFETRLVSHPDGKESGLGRMLFMLVDLAQRHHLDAEVALQKINAQCRQKVREHANNS
jgi:MazG family protein